MAFGQLFDESSTLLKMSSKYSMDMVSLIFNFLLTYKMDHPAELKQQKPDFPLSSLPKQLLYIIQVDKELFW